MTDPAPSLSRLLHPAFVAAVAVLLVNDHVLKAAALGLVTGKLSDIAGLVVLPVLVCALLGVASRRAVWAVHAAVGAVFAGMQFVPAGPWLDALSALVGVRLHHTADAADLVALAVLPAGVWIARRPAAQFILRRHPSLAVLRVPVAAVAVLSVLGTSMPYVAPLITDAPLTRAASPAEAFARMERTLEDAGLTVERLDGRFALRWYPGANGDSAAAHQRFDSLRVAKAEQGIRSYSLAFRQRVEPEDTLNVSVDLWTRWTEPVLTAETIRVWAYWPDVRRRRPSDDELRAIVRARVLAPLEAGGVR